MKIRLNLTNQDLAYRFNVSVFHISTLLNEGFQTLASMQLLVRWPSKDCVLRTLPWVFRPRFFKCRVIIDCTEIFIERARNLTVRVMRWSNYKHHNTIKILVGIAPTGAISFLSKAFYHNETKQCHSLHCHMQSFFCTKADYRDKKVPDHCPH